MFCTDLARDGFAVRRDSRSLPNLAYLFPAAPNRVGAVGPTESAGWPGDMPGLEIARPLWEHRLDNGRTAVAIEPTNAGARP